MTVSTKTAPRPRSTKAALPKSKTQSSPQLPEKAAEATVDGVSLLFDPDWYRSEYPDVAAAGIDPIRHYFDDGAREGRNPNPYFNTRSYVSRYEDVAASRMNPFLHYLLYGAREGRAPRE